MKVLKLLDRHLEEVFIVPLFIIMNISIFAQVIMRKVFNSSLSWSEELARYCLIWMVFFGISYGVKLQRHIKIDLIYDKVNAKNKRFLRVFSSIVFIIFGLIILFYGQKIAMRLLMLKQSSPALHIPMGLLYAAAPVGLGLSIIRLIQNIINEFRKTPKEDSLA